MSKKRIVIEFNEYDAIVTTELIRLEESERIKRIVQPEGSKTLEKYKDEQNRSHNALIEISARWESICEILEGNEASDFMLSFPEVREVSDLKQATEKKE